MERQKGTFMSRRKHSVCLSYMCSGEGGTVLKLRFDHSVSTRSKGQSVLAPLVGGLPAECQRQALTRVRPGL